MTNPGQKASLAPGATTTFSFDTDKLTDKWKLLLRACRSNTGPDGAKLKDPTCSDFSEAYVCRFEAAGSGLAGAFIPGYGHDGHIKCSATTKLGMETTFVIG